MKNYVLGFLFSPDLENVALILKNRPDFLAGKLNGIGGHVEEDESPTSAVIREFEEESGLRTTREDWTLVDVGNFKDGTRITTFSGTGDISKCKSMTDEPVIVMRVEDALRAQNVPSDLPDLIRMSHNVLNQAKMKGRLKFGHSL